MLCCGLRVILGGLMVYRLWRSQAQLEVSIRTAERTKKSKASGKRMSFFPEPGAKHSPITVLYIVLVSSESKNMFLCRVLEI